MPSFWVERADVGPAQLVLRGDEAHHLQRVRRQREGDLIDVVDGAGQFYRARVVRLGRREVLADIVERHPGRGESCPQLLLAPALIKGQRFDFVVEKATELGACAIWPLWAERGVASRCPAGRLERWQRLARAATKQCGRSRCPQVRPPAPLGEVLDEWLHSCDVVLLATPGAGGLGAALASGRPVRRLGLLVGPEGGFSPAEVEMAQGRGARPFSWGPRVLRADTASVALAALVLYAGQLARGEGGCFDT